MKISKFKPDINEKEKLYFDRSSDIIYKGKIPILNFTGFLDKTFGAPCTIKDKGCFFLNGKKTTLDENGTGAIKNKFENYDYYVFG